MFIWAVGASFNPRVARQPPVAETAIISTMIVALDIATMLYLLKWLEMNPAILCS